MQRKKRKQEKKSHFDREGGVVKHTAIDSQAEVL